jgi:acyl-ACP thioesterase
VTPLVPLPERGRRFTGHAVVRLGDADPRGEARLDAIARFLQDVANDDALDAGLDNAMGWVVRRTTIRLDQPAVLGERLDLTTFCSGTGRSWAERRTSISGDRGAAIEAVSLWVQVDVATGRPARLGDGFFARYAEAAGGRTVSSRLTLDPPPPDAETRPWPVRTTDLDVFGHANNATLWSALEDAMAPATRCGFAEIEYPGPVDAGARVEAQIVTGERPAAWLVEDGVVRSAARWRGQATSTSSEASAE